MATGSSSSGIGVKSIGIRDRGAITSTTAGISDADFNNTSNELKGDAIGGNFNILPLSSGNFTDPTGDQNDTTVGSQFTSTQPGGNDREVSGEMIIEGFPGFVSNVRIAHSYGNLVEFNGTATTATTSINDTYTDTDKLFAIHPKVFEGNVSGLPTELSVGTGDETKKYLAVNNDNELISGTISISGFGDSRKITAGSGNVSYLIETPLIEITFTKKSQQTAGMDKLIRYTSDYDNFCINPLFKIEKIDDDRFTPERNKDNWDIDCFNQLYNELVVKQKKATATPETIKVKVPVMKFTNFLGANTASVSITSDPQDVTTYGFKQGDKKEGKTAAFGSMNWAYGLKNADATLGGYAGVNSDGVAFDALLTQINRDQQRPDLQSRIVYEVAPEGESLNSVYRGIAVISSINTSGGAGEPESRELSVKLSKGFSSLTELPAEWRFAKGSNVSAGVQSIITAWQTNNNVWVRYLPNGKDGRQVLCMVSDTSFTGSLDDVMKMSLTLKVVGGYYLVADNQVKSGNKLPL